MGKSLLRKFAAELVDVEGFDMVAVTPREPGAPGSVFEFKVLRSDRGETLDSALDSALKQIAERNYVQELKEAGAEPVVSWGVVFDGKRVWVKKAARTD